MLSKRQIALVVGLAGLCGGALWVASLRDSNAEPLADPGAAPRSAETAPRSRLTQTLGAPTLGAQTLGAQTLGTEPPDSRASEASVAERRLEADSELDRQGAAARSALIERQTRQLEGAIGRAEARGFTERARLMRARVDALARARRSQPSGASADPFSAEP